MKSISRKILKTSLLWQILITVFITSVSILVVTGISKRDSEELLTQVCEKETLRFNDTFRLLENSVTTVSSYVHDFEKECASEEELLSDEFCKRVLDTTMTIANRTDGAMAVYFRYNPELTGNGTEGFFWSRESDDESFSYFEPTDILQYDQDDIEHVGWFYEPKKRQEPMWMSPYYNKNLNVFMISYIVPYYTESGEFLGVIGMDIDFKKIIELAGEANIYKSGRIELIDLSTYLTYSYSEDGSVEKNNLSTTLYNHITTIDKENETLVTKSSNGIAYKTCASRLENGMRLILYVPISEVDAQRNYLVIIFGVIMIIVLTCSIYSTVRMTNNMVIPLRRLTRITGEYAKGDWSNTFISDTEDEIQELSESISIMAETTKSYIDTINQNAMKDSLTGLKNKNCYLSYIQKYMGDAVAENEEYAVAVFDINYLKKVNDAYGHEMGDELIIRAGQYICQTFVHSPVFRIGGDEYTAILERGDFNNRESLCEAFEEGLRSSAPIVGNIPLSIAYGIACHKTDGNDFDEVFKRADLRMYECKKKMKVGR